MIERFVRTLLAPLYELIGASIPILFIFVIGILLLFFIGNIKMHIKRKGDNKIDYCYVPYMDKGELEYVITGKK